MDLDTSKKLWRQVGFWGLTLIMVAAGAASVPAAFIPGDAFANILELLKWAGGLFILIAGLREAGKKMGTAE